jgi:hypothetical protein
VYGLDAMRRTIAPWRPSCRWAGLSSTAIVHVLDSKRRRLVMFNRRAAWLVDVLARPIVAGFEVPAR